MRRRLRARSRRGGKNWRSPVGLLLGGCATPHSTYSSAFRQGLARAAIRKPQRGSQTPVGRGHRNERFRICGRAGAGKSERDGGGMGRPSLPPRQRRQPSHRLLMLGVDQFRFRFVSSLARSGGNLTGALDFALEVAEAAGAGLQLCWDGKSFGFCSTRAGRQAATEVARICSKPRTLFGLQAHVL